jgi:hypothetical protein
VMIIVSLIYMATQIRQNTYEVTRSIEATRLAAFERNIESGNRIRELLMLHDDLAEVFLKGMKSYHNLDVTQKFRFGMLLRNLFSSTQGAYIRQMSVDHDPGGFDGMAKLVDSIVVSPGVREWLAKQDLDWRPEFRIFVDERVAAFGKTEKDQV